MNSGEDQYIIKSKLGEGGMGTVYLAEDTMLERKVAIKQVAKNFGGDEQSGNRFQQEALALARLNHPNITHLYSFLVRDNDYWMVMEYVQGKTLEDWIAHHGKINPTLAASIAVHLLEGLIHAHKKGIIHRDLKPANVMVDEDGEIKIMDFGIARIRNSQRITRHGKSVGTLEYMAPEQIQGAEGDERTDVYAVGNILFEMVCGRPPFQSDTDYHIMKAKLDSEAPEVGKINATVPLALQKVIAKALERKPERRYESAYALQQALVQSVQNKVLSISDLLKAMNTTQHFDEPDAVHHNAITKMLEQARKFSGKINTKDLKKIDKPVLLLLASVVICMVLLLWNFLSGPSEPEPNTTQNYVVTDTTTNVTKTDSVPEDETPNELYQRIINQQNNTSKSTGDKEATDNESKKKSSEQTKKPVTKDPPESVAVTTPDKTSSEVDESKNNSTEKKDSYTSHSPVTVPAGRSIQVVLDETLSSEEKSRDGTQVQLHCAEDIQAEGRVIIKKGASVTGKIVDVVPSGSRKKALIGFVIQKIEAVDGTIIKLSSERYRLFANTTGVPALYNKGQSFRAELGRGVVH